MKIKIYNYFLLYASIFLLVSPSFSLIYALTPFYIPNEKIFIVIILFLIPFWKIKYSLHSGEKVLLESTILLACYIICLLFIRFFLGGVPPSISNFNHIISLVMLPFAAIFFARYSVADFIKAISSAQFAQLLFSLWQTQLHNNGIIDAASMFNNVPIQEGYSFPLSFFETPRVFGLFQEASQLGLFSAITFWIGNLGFFSTFKDNTKQVYIYQTVNFFELNYLLRIALSVSSVLCLILGFSVSGTLALILPFCLLAKPTIEKLFYELKLNKTGVIILSILGSLGFASQRLADYVVQTFLSSQRRQFYDSTFFKALPQDSFLTFLLGKEQVSDNAAWDAYFRLYQIFGLLGQVPQIAWILFVSLRRLSPFSFVLLVSTFTNALFSSPHAFVLFLVCILYHFDLRVYPASPPY